MTPSVGRVVHYVSRGSADGVFPPACRAAIITEIGVDRAELRSHGEKEPLAAREFVNGTVGLAVLNPTGLFLDRGIEHSEAYPMGSPAGRVCDPSKHTPGTWHWPARVE